MVQGPGQIRVLASQRQGKVQDEREGQGEVIMAFLLGHCSAQWDTLLPGLPRQESVPRQLWTLAQLPRHEGRMGLQRTSRAAQPRQLPTQVTRPGIHRGNQASRGHSPQVPWALPMPPTQRALTQWTGSASDAWAELQQWMQFVPQRLHEHLPPQTSAHLLLYAGKDDATSLDSCTRKLFPDLSTELIALDIRRDGKEVKHDLLRDQPYSDLCASWKEWAVAPPAAHGASSDGFPSREHHPRYEVAGNPTAAVWTA